MSQVLFKTNYQGRSVEVMTGWSPRESQVFVTVGYLDGQGQWLEDENPALEIVKHVSTRPTEVEPAAYLASEVQHKLLKVGIALPSQLLGELAAHIVLDAGNVVVEYDQQGKRNLIMGDLEAPPGL